MKILIITPRIPYPPYRGDKLKIYNLARHLTKLNEVTICTNRLTSGEDDDFDRLQKELKVQVCKSNLSLSDIFIQIISAIFSSLPFQVAIFKSSNWAHAIINRVTSQDFDVVYLHLIRSAWLIHQIRENAQNAKIIVDFTDAVSLYLERLVSAEQNWFRKMVFSIEAKRIQKYETITNHFDHVFVCSDTDRQKLMQNGVTVPVSLLPNGVDVSTFSDINVEVDSNRLIFTGNMPYFPNTDAAIYLATEIFPIILEEQPEAKLYLVGQKPPLSVRRLASENIHVTGFVEDIRKEYLKSAVNVAPMRYGAGTLNKIIESLVLGVPVVATSVSIMGLPDELKSIIFVADTPNDIAWKINHVLDDQKNIRQNTMAFREKAKQVLNWNTILSEFESNLHQIIQKK